MKVKDVGIIGFGSYAPNNIVTNKDIEYKVCGTSDVWTRSKLGISERRISQSEKTSDLAYESSARAIENADINKSQIDMIIVATSTPDRLSPSTACILAQKLDLKCPAFDINAVCTGFVYGIQLATSLINTGQHKNILLVASETYSKITDWSQRNCVFFGDGSGAVILSKIKGGWISTDLYSDGNGKENFTCRHGEKFQMNGKAVYDFGTTILPKTILNSLNKNSLETKDISWIVPHQPSILVLKKTAKSLNFPADKMIFNMEKFANTAGASIPMALDIAYSSKKFKDNDLIVMPAIGSGWTWGVSILKYKLTP